MLTTPHALVGLVIINKSPNFLGLFLALISHFILDFFLPHWNPHIYTEFKKSKKVSYSSLKIILVDGILAVILTLFIMSKNLPNLTQTFLFGLAAFLAISPDLIAIPYYFLKQKNKLLKTYIAFERKYQSHCEVFWGMITQIIVVLVCFKILLF